MSDSTITQISQILMKPTDSVLLTEEQALSDDYVAELNDLLQQQDYEACLAYVRPMSMGVHVLRIEPAVALELLKPIVALLADRDDIEYAEPDLPRRR